MNFESGALGNPAELSTLVRFWSQMEVLHYPMAESIKKDLQEELEKQNAAGVAEAMNDAAGQMPVGTDSGMPADFMGALTGGMPV